jgi:peptidoglycan glycosyltransferase
MNDWSLPFPAIPVRALTHGLQTAFFVLASLFLVQAVWTSFRRRTAGRGGGREPLVLSVGVALLLIAAYAYQASWQLAGFARPGFVGFLQRYARRADNPAEGFIRGRVLDRNGLVLAESPAGDPRRRLYPQRADFAHVVGYSDPRYGQAGVEAAENLYLNGGGLRSVARLDRFGQNLLRHGGVRGNDVTLTLDARLQHKAMLLLGGRRGAVVGLRPADGAVLILASSPAFDPNDFLPDDVGREGDSPMFNRALRGQYPPGSVFKIALAALALERGFRDRIACPAQGFVPVAGHPPIRDDEYYAFARRGQRWPGHGSLDLREGFIHSSNVFFARLGVSLAGPALDDMIRRFLFAERLTVLQGSCGSLSADPCGVPDLANGGPAEVAVASIGQGVLTVTPFHMALLAAAIANDGVCPEPRCRADAPSRARGRFVSVHVAREVRDLMRHAVLEGTARALRTESVAIAGKTGTAQNPHGESHGWFVCFAPVDRPALALAVIVENAGYGSQSALPIARELIRQADTLGLLDEDGARATAVPPGGNR